MNYIKLLNAVFEKFYFDDRLNPTHISLYMALFQEWNSSRFADEFYVNRRDVMRCAKIGSKSTYHRCITDLDSWLYLCYFPSNNPYKGSKIKMSIIGTSSEPDMGRYNPTLEQLAEQYYPIREPVVGQHHLPTKIVEDGIIRFIYVMPKFSLSSDRRAILELNEKDGERNIKLNISHRYINNPN